VTVTDRSNVGVEFDVPASWVRVELDHPETWRYLTDQVAQSVAVFRERGLADGIDDSQLNSQMENLCEDLLEAGIAALASRSLVAEDNGVATLITGMVTLALAAADPPVGDVDELLAVWQSHPDAEARVVSLPCGQALRVDLKVEGPGLLYPEPLTYRHTRYLVPVFDGRVVAIMVCATPLGHAECFDLVFDQISQTLREGDGS
jgi:hypothetical protein